MIKAVCALQSDPKVIPMCTEYGVPNRILGVEFFYCPHAPQACLQRFYTSKKEY